MSYSSFLILLQKNPHIKFVDLLLTDLNGVFRGKRYPVSSIESIVHKGMRLPLSTIGVDIWGQDVVENGLVFETGDQDGICWPVSPVRIPYHHPDDVTQKHSQSNVAEIMMSMSHIDGYTPFMADPRQILSHALNWYYERELTPVMATELEFYLFSDKDLDNLKKSLSSTIPMPANDIYSMSALNKYNEFFDDLYSICERQQIPVETAISEGGKGQFEVNLLHNSNILQMADHTLVFKHLVKKIAKKHGVTASFMAKPKQYDSGNGMHVHTSIYDAQENNIFDQPEGQENTLAASELMQSAIAGLLQTATESMLIFAPHANSYRRFNTGSHAPVTLSWGYDNRTSAIRIPEISGNAARLEHRISGADSNPYLVMASILAGMAYGIENQLVPQSATVGNAYEQDNYRLPTEWDDAIFQFENSKILKPILGEQFFKVFSACKRQEMRQIYNHISPFELSSYLRTV